MHFRESDADAICEVAGLVPTSPLKVVVVDDVTAGLAGLASAGDERAELQLLLAMETAFISITVSPVKLGVELVGTRGDEERTVAAGAEQGMLVKVPSSSFGASESVAGITDDCGCSTSLNTFQHRLNAWWPMAAIK